MRLLLAAILTGALCVGLPACEDDPPPGPPPGAQGGQPGAKPGTPGEAAKPGAATPAKPGATADGKAVAKKKGDKGKAAAPAPKPVAKPETRVPSASEMLGLGKRRSSGGKELPDFIRNRKANAPNPLFAGRLVQPSKAYEKTKGQGLPGVSPIARKWGATHELGRAKQGKKAVLSAPGGATPSGIFKRPGSAPAPSQKTGAKPEVAPKSAAPTYPLVLYRLDRTTGEVEIFERTFTSREGHRAAKQFAMRQGYKPARPTGVEVAAIKKAHDAARRAAREKACQFRAQWNDGGVKQSRCFASQAHVDAFMAERRKRAAAAAAPAKPAPKAPVAPKPAPPAPVEERSLQPVKIGQ